MGWFVLCDEGNHLLLTGPARGKADSKRAIEAGNPTRDPTRPYGDTPSGTFFETGVVTFATPHRRLGTGWLQLRGKSGDALQAMTNGRTGLGIHAGREGDKLWATYGCVRLLTDDYDALAQHLYDRGNRVSVKIVDVEVTV